MKTIKKIVVIGAGPAGMMAAIRAAQLQQDVVILERNSLAGKKLLLSGKGRCNLTNACDLEQFLKRFSRNAQFLRDAFKKFFNHDLVEFFEKRGLKLKTERQLRIFPVTDTSSSILTILINELKQSQVKIVFKAEAKEILIEGNKVKGIRLIDGGIIAADKIILATGGLSYSFTGSSGTGFIMAKALGHSTVALRPGLVPLETKEAYVRFLEGVTLKNIRLKFKSDKKEIISEIGELLFTGFGISGPLVLTLSGQVIDWLSEKIPVEIEIDLKPALSKEQLDARLLREFTLNSKKTVKNILKTLLPQKIISIFIDILKIEPDKKASQVSRQERQELISLLKRWRLTVVRARSLEEAMVTRGGISLKEINPRTMESRLIQGLYFAGEIIDVDADTGGFNLQAAFSTGYLAGESAALA